MCFKASYLDDAPCVLCHREVHISSLPCPPHRLHSQQVFPGTLHQLVMLYTNSGQYHALGAVVVAQVAVQHDLVNLVNVLWGAEAGQAHCVSPIRSLGRRGDKGEGLML